MKSRFFPYEKSDGFRQIVKLGSPTTNTGFALLTLKNGDSYSGANIGTESVLVILSGKCTVTVQDVEYTNLGSRRDVFSGKATSVYIPREATYKVVEANNHQVEIAILSALTSEDREPFVVMPEEVTQSHRGSDNYQRDIYDIMIENHAEKVSRIVVGETIANPGHWTSFPSHKHDTYRPPVENKMDEIYFYKMKPDNGFGVQLVYNDDSSMRDAYMIKDGDTIAIPEGYHPLVAAPGYQIYYLWVMAGPYERTLMPYDDPNLSGYPNHY